MWLNLNTSCILLLPVNNVISQLILSVPKNICDTHMTSLWPAWEYLLCPASIYHPPICRQYIFPIHSGGVHSEWSETVVVVGIDAKDGIVDIKQWRSLMEIAASGQC